MQTRRLAQERLLSANQMLLFSVVFSLLMLFSTGVRALEVETSYSFPQIGQWAPPAADLVEGAVVATFTGDEPITLLSANLPMEQIDAHTWTCLFPWDWTVRLQASFSGAGGEIYPVSAQPQPVMPFGSESHQLGSFHITTPRANLWDPATGIYVYGDFANFLQRGAEWERLAQIDFFNPDDQTAFSELVGLRINGGWSRRFDQKSFRFYFDDYGTSQELDYDFFGGTPTNYQRLILRTHRFPFNCFNSDLLEGIWLDQGHLGSRIRPVAGYINNEYWGVYSLRERLDDEFLEITHGIEPGSYTFIKDGIVEKGDPFDWANVIASFSEAQDFASHAWFEDITGKVDLHTYIDWLILNIFAASADNGFDANLAQLKEGDGPWKFIMWDEDDTFYLQNLNADYFRFYASEDQAAFEANWPPVFYYDNWDPSLQAWCNIFNGFMQNSEFKAIFFERLDELMAMELSPQSIASKVDNIVAEQGEEMERHAQRWNWSSAAEFTDHADALKSWSNARHEIVLDQAAAFKEDYRLPVELVDFQAVSEADGVHLTWSTKGERNNAGFLVIRKSYLGEVTVVDSYINNQSLVGQDYTDELMTYSALDTKPNDGTMNNYSLVYVENLQPPQPQPLPWTESVWVAKWDGLVFNEFMADNDSTLADAAGEFDDWLELYNGSAATVVLDSLYITDDPTDPMRHQLLGFYMLNPGEHLLLWADGSPEQGIDHLNFKLSSAGEGLYLFAPDGETLITLIEFGTQVTDVSQARELDGADDWVYSAASTPGFVNGDPLTYTLLRFNELMSDNEEIIADEAGEYDPWLELYNPLPVPIPLAGLELTFSGLVSGIWVFSGQEAAPGCQLMWLDGQPDQGEFHANFVLGSGFGSLELSVVDSDDKIDFFLWEESSPTTSLARLPDGYGPWVMGVDPTPGVSNPLPQQPNSLFINEFMALNGSIVTDETGAYEDWVEIYNPGQDTVSLDGMYLTDDLAQTTRWAFPDTTIAPGEFMIVWCDSDPLDGPLHASFKLSSSGESIALFTSVENGNSLIDGYTFGVQTVDVSEGRNYDGGPDWDFFPLPSPGYTNSPTSGVLPGPILVTGLKPNYPNPFNPQTTIVFAMERPGDVFLSVHDVSGRLVRTLLREWRSAGEHQVVWDGKSSQGIPVASGVYLARIKTGSLHDSRRMLLLK